MLFSDFREVIGGHFEYRPLEKLAVIFERYIGANFSSKWSRMSYQLRKKGRERMVTDSVKRTLLLAISSGLLNSSYVDKNFRVTQNLG